jgi:hypothetical protein
MDDFDQIVCAFGALVGRERGRRHVTADMVLDYFGHKTVHGSADGSDNLQHVGAAHLGLKGAFDGFNLPSDTPYAGQQLGFFANGVHGTSLLGT